MHEGRTLYLLTATFPYGTKETFLETEITYLCDRFSRVVVIPLAGDLAIVRSVPENCEVKIPIIKNTREQYSHLFSSKGFKLFVQDFFVHQVWSNRQRLKTWFIAYVLLNNYLQSRQIKNVIRELKTDDVVYSYWGKGGCYLAPFLKGKAKFVSRFHGEWDLWEESCGNYAPIRKQVSEALNLAVFISQKGERYFKERYNCPTFVSRLGTINGDICTPKSKDGVLRVVSCSSVYPLKRVPLIFEALQLINETRVEWTHIGAGADFGQLKSLVQGARSNVNVKLLGHVPNKDVLAYYENNPVDVFINVSTNEGVPVSIIEAISYDIPAIATDVGGTSEVVIPETGLLLSSDPRPIEIKKAILKINTLNLSPHEFWAKNYNADINYRLFAQKLSEL